MIDFVQVGRKITSLRKNQSWSQEFLADKLYITRQCLSKWENGTSIPSIDILIELANIFQVSIDEILCLNETLEIDPSNIFIGHERMFIIKKLITNELDVRLDEIFYQLSPTERLMILKSIKEGKTKCDMNSLRVKLTISEQNYLGGELYELEESSY